MGGGGGGGGGGTRPKKMQKLTETVSRLTCCFGGCAQGGRAEQDTSTLDCNAAVCQWFSVCGLLSWMAESDVLCNVNPLHVLQQRRFRRESLILQDTDEDRRQSHVMTHNLNILM